MSDYRLDELGWFHFERLVQVLLKAELGIGVESWGGQGDYGRDAYACGRFAFPSRKVLKEGPFLFQAKFVSGANAAGADPGPSLLKAVSAEAKRIQERVSSGSWRDPRFYVLLTNVPVTPRIRREIRKRLKSDIPNSSIHISGMVDICDLIKLHPQIVPSFPELLSLRDLELLLRDTVNREILERSRGAVQEARELARTFAPTSSYRKAWEVLQEHHFVVLDGPPEMGKTAIARMIALAQISQHWQAIECRTTDDFFAQVDSATPQVFVADDAFGRTEYDVTLGRSWERDLPRILRRLDSGHWLIWTTRKHILLRALKEMDLVEPANEFPSPGEVIVSAEDLSVEEKSRILYRHAKIVSLSDYQKSTIKNNAVKIVNDKHFTPERIRRFVVDHLPNLPEIDSISEEDLSAEVAEAIRNPTDRMKKSYIKLPQECKWCLVAMLEFAWRAEISALGRRFAEISGNRSREVFSEAMDDLTGTFVRVWPNTSREAGEDRLDWIHPSYRDLVIGELSKDARMQQRFLSVASIIGLQLSLSATDDRGSQRFLLLSFDESWQILEDRCIHMALVCSEEDLTRLLILFKSALKFEKMSKRDQRRLDEIARRTCESACRRWDDTKCYVGSSAIDAYLSVSELLRVKPPSPNIKEMWALESDRLKFTEGDARELDGRKLESWLRAVEIVQTKESEFSVRVDFKERARGDFHEITRIIREDVKLFYSFDRSDGYEYEADRLESVEDVLKKIFDEDYLESIIESQDFSELDDLISKISHRVEEYRESGFVYDNSNLMELEKEKFSVEELFSDL